MANIHVEKMTNEDIKKMNLVCGNEKILNEVDEYKRIEATRTKSDLLSRSPLSTFIPAIYDPVKIVCCNFHIFQDDAGQGNYLSSDVPRLKQLFDWAAGAVANSQDQSDVYPPAPLPPFRHTKICLKLDRIEFYADTALHMSTSVSALQAAAVARNSSTLDNLNTYWSAGSYGGAAGFATLPSAMPGFDSWIVMLAGQNPTQDFAVSTTLAHEFGHVLDLQHTYLGGTGCDASSPDFLADVFGTSPNTCPHVCSWGVSAFVQEPLLPNTVITNNLMGGNHINNWISPLQAAMMHRALTEKSVKRYLATGCKDCASCVAFTARGDDHVSSGGSTPLTYMYLDTNISSGFVANAFVAPVSGIYHFDLSFVKDSYISGGTQDDVWVVILRNGAFLGRAWSGYGAGGRGTGCISLNAQLQAGDVISAAAQSEGGAQRHLIEHNFSGHLICGCC